MSAASLWRSLLVALTIPAVWAASFLAALSLIPGEGVPRLDTICGVNTTSVYGTIRHAESVRVVVAVDEEWAEGSDGSVETEARRLLANTSATFRGIGIRFIPVKIVAWSSPDWALSADELLDSLQESVPVGAEHIVAGLSGQTTGKTDGRAEVSGQYAFVRRHPGRQDLDALVLAHEFSHLFGARHGCDLPGVEGLMASRGFDEMFILCPCTRRVLQANAHRFHVETSR